MKKKLIVTISAVVVATVLGIGIYQSDASQADPKLSTSDIMQMVTDQYPGTITELELEKEFNKVVYEVEVVSNGKEYDLKLDGDTGEVLKLKEKSVVKRENMVQDDVDDADDNIDDASKNQDKVADKANKTPAKRTVIDAQTAIEIALKEFPGIVTDLDLDEDDGRLIYEIEIKSGRDEAEFDIDAYTGEILVIDIDIDNDDDED